MFAALWMLVVNDLRLSAREFPAGRLARIATAIFWLSILFAFAGRVALSTFVVKDVALSQVVFLTTSLALLIVFQLLFALSSRSVLTFLFERADLDLMLSSPLDPRIVLTARMLGIALTGFFSLAIVTLPLLILALTTFGWRPLGLIFVVFSLSALATALATTMVLLLVRALGVTRTRIVMQLSGLLSMVSGFVIVQLYAFTPKVNWVQVLADFTRSSQLEVVLQVVTLPARAVFFAPLELLVTLLFGAASLAAAVYLSVKAFLVGSIAQSTGAATSARSLQNRADRLLFSPHALVVLLRRDWRVLTRTPLVLTQIGSQLAYTVPFGLLFFLPSSGILGQGYGLLVAAFFSIFVCASVAQNLYRLALVSDEAFELAGAAPLETRFVTLARIILTALPLGLLVLLVSARVAPSDLRALGLPFAYLLAVILSVIYTNGLRPVSARGALEIAALKFNPGLSIAVGVLNLGVFLMIVLVTPPLLLGILFVASSAVVYGLARGDHQKARPRVASLVEQGTD